MTDKNNNKPANMPDLFNGPIVPTTIRLFVPVMIGELLTFFSSFVDAFFISLIDKKSTALLSGPGLIFPVFFIFITIGIGLLIGVNSLVARGIGSRNQEIIEKTTSSAVLICIILGAFTFSLGFLFGERLIHLLAGSQLSEESIEYAVEYFYFLLPGMVLIVFLYIIGGLWQGQGLQKYIAVCMYIFAISNIILNPILIFALKLGVKGSAAATSASVVIALFYCAFVFIKKKTAIPFNCNIFNSSKKVIKEIMRISVPASVSLFSVSISIIILNNLVSSISQTAMNSWVLVGRIDQIVIVPANALAGITIAMIGQNYGSRNFQRVEKIFNKHIIMSIVFSAILVLIYVLSAPVIFSLFSAIPEVIDSSVRQVRFLSFTWIMLSGSIIIASSFQATGIALPSFILTILRTIAISIPLSFLLVNVFSMGINGIFISLIAGNLIAFIIAVFWGKNYIKGLHRKVRTL